MTTADGVRANPHRYRLHRAGVLNVWQYDEQVFDFADGRLLLRGANGAGKSKTLEMLLPFALDGDKLRITASGRHHTSLLWLMTDGHEGNRTGYLWVEFARETDDGSREVLTCGVGVRASGTSKAATSWYFTCPRRVGVDLHLEDEAGPLPRDRCRAAVTPDGAFFDQPRAYKQHVGRVLFGLEPAQYDELLRLLYWLRQPQVGEDIEPAKLAEQLAQALPQVDDDALRTAGDTFDELAAFGEQIQRRERAAAAVAGFAATYAAYARTVVRDRGAALAEALRESRRRRTAVETALAEVERSNAEAEAAGRALEDTERRLEQAQARLRQLHASPEARSQQRLMDLDTRSRELTRVANLADRAARRSAERAGLAAERVTTDRASLSSELLSYAEEGQQRIADASRAGVGRPTDLPALLHSPRLENGAAATAIAQALDGHAESVRGLGPAVGELLAAVRVVEEARGEAAAAAARRETEERRAAEAEQRAEQERGRREDAARAARTAEADYAERIAAWQAQPAGIPVELPDLTAAALPALASLVRAAAAPGLERLRGEQAEAAARRVPAAAAATDLRARRRALEAEQDPAPPAPALRRTPRPDTGGAPLWRLVDFRADVDPDQRAALEAALQDAGLLDAWVRADGAVLDPGRLDVVLPAGPPAAAARTLADVLAVDVPDRCTVPAQVVGDVLARIALGADTGADTAVVDISGSWRLGPLTGRAAKPAAQYVGATARAAERTRRIAAVDADLARVEGEEADAAAAERRARERAAGLEEWLTALPSPQPLLTAWTRLDERAAAALRAEGTAAAAEQSAAQARAEGVARRRRLDELAERHGLPITAELLAARREELRSLDDQIRRHADRAAPLRHRVNRWAQDHAGWQADRAHAEEQRADAAAAEQRAQQVAAERDALAEAAGAGVQELRRRVGATTAEIDAATTAGRELRTRLGNLREAVGAARTAHREAESRQAEHQPVLAVAVSGLAALRGIPGILRSALDRPVEDSEVGAFDVAGGVEPAGPVPAPVRELARRLAALPAPAKPTDAVGLATAWQSTATSEAADHEPRLVPYAAGGTDVLAALGRDDGGEHPVAVLAERLAAAVVRDRELLTDRERTLFEEHLIGDLGQVLRTRRLEAVDLVESMNQLLAGVTTSQGIAVRLHWRLREDVPEDARRAVTLLGQPVGALLPRERAELRDALHRLIEASRAEAVEDSYTEHLSRALDYRRWFAFRIRYTRPELDGRWQDLHRRSPLSQGEQKVVCYLPLFAAAAAHFTSLAGAAPHAPRFVLLDDAFPKIDVRTHPLLFGLLVDLDLDFVVTSERLWGDHATVPSLAIYEALRDPAERGVAQYRYRWDGARLQAVGS